MALEYATSDDDIIVLLSAAIMAWFTTLAGCSAGIRHGMRPSLLSGSVSHSKVRCNLPAGCCERQQHTTEPTEAFEIGAQQDSALFQDDSKASCSSLFELEV